LPQIDESQDWILLDSKQNSTHTIIKFSRPYTTCDKEFDRQITRDTTRLIYAYSDSDPKSFTNFRIHGRHERGSKSVLLLSYTESFQNEPKETDLKSFTLSLNNVCFDQKINLNMIWAKNNVLTFDFFSSLKYQIKTQLIGVNFLNFQILKFMS